MTTRNLHMQLHGATLACHVIDAVPHFNREDVTR